MKHCPTCHCDTQAKAGKARMARLSAEERSELGRRAALAKGGTAATRPMSLRGEGSTESIQNLGGLSVADEDRARSGQGDRLKPKPNPQAVGIPGHTQRCGCGACRLART
jgi:hypothetical protein